MAYENKIAIESCIKKVHEQQGTTEKIQPIINELETTYCKAKAFDEIKKLIIEKLKEEEEKPRILLDDYDYGLYQAYENVDDIIQEYKERADDEVNGNTKPKNDSVSKYIDRLDDDNIMG